MTSSGQQGSDEDHGFPSFSVIRGGRFSQSETETDRDSDPDPVVDRDSHPDPVADPGPDPDHEADSDTPTPPGGSTSGTGRTVPSGVNSQQQSRPDAAGPGNKDRVRGEGVDTDRGGGGLADVGAQESVAEVGSRSDPEKGRSGSDKSGSDSAVHHGREASAVDEEDRSFSLESEEADAVAAIASQATALLEDGDPAVYYRALRGLVRDNHSSVLAPLDYSPDFPFHEPARVFIEPEPTTVDTALLYARAAYPEFDDVLLNGFSDPSRSDLLVALYDLLFAEKRNVALVTNHGQTIDIALVLAALFAAMLADDHSFGVLGEKLDIEDMARHSNTLVSRMVVTRQAFGVPAVQVLQSISRIFLSVPQTASRRRAKLDPALVRANNVLMRLELEQRLAEGGQLVAMAASGTQDLTIPQLMHRARSAWRQRRGDDPGEEPTLHLQPLYNGTISLMRSCDYVLPVAICLDARSPACVVGSLTRLREDDDCHRIMDWIAEAHQQATGTPTIYHRQEDDLLGQVRALINR